MRATKMRPAFARAVEVYVGYQRTLGRNYVAVKYIWDGLRRYIDAQRARDLTSLLYTRWCKHQCHLSPNTVRNRQYVVRKFCLYRRRREPLYFVPEPLFAKLRPYIEPVLITEDHIARMLKVIGTLPAASVSPLRPAVMRMAVVLLYTAGLRRGELVRLRLGDVDAQTGVLRVCESKFHRSRLVPLSKDAHRELRSYLRHRLVDPYDQRTDAPLLFNMHDGSCRAYTGAGMAQAINSIFVLATVHDEEGRQPRVHDTRHNSRSRIIPPTHLRVA